MHVNRHELIHACFSATLLKMVTNARDNTSAIQQVVVYAWSYNLGNMCVIVLNIVRRVKKKTF